MTTPRHAAHDVTRVALVFGASGYLGRALQTALDSAGWRVHAPSHAEVDVADAEAVERCLAEARPGVVYSLAAAQPGSSSAVLRQVNVEGAGVVAQASADHGARLVHLSTDMVLGGDAVPYGDDAAVAPITPYGKSKAEGERLVRQHDPRAVCVRTSLIYDLQEMPRGIRGFEAALARGERVALFADEMRCPVARSDLVEGLLGLAQLPVHGTLNLAGPESLSRMAYGAALLAHFAVVGAERVEAGTLDAYYAGGSGARPRELVLDSAVAYEALGLAPRRLTRHLASVATSPGPGREAEAGDRSPE